MGLNDILTGVLNGPRGQRQPSASAGTGGGMSPMLMALLGLLAYKAFAGRSGQAAPPGGASAPADSGGGFGGILGGLLGGTRSGAPGTTATQGNLPGGLGGLLGGGAAGSVLSSGLGNLLKGFQESGHGSVAQSWIGSGDNQQIAPNDLAAALGSDTVDALSQQTGMKREELLGHLSDMLPRFVDQLTPQGRLPTEEEASRMV